MRSSHFFLHLLSVLTVSWATGSGDDIKIEIIVSNEGNDTHLCYTGEVHCLTLDYALDGLQVITNDVKITIYDREQNLTRPHLLDGVKNVIITANVMDDNAVDFEENVTMATVTCEDVGAGLSFTHSVNITVSWISWVDCSIKHETSALGNWSCSLNDSCWPLIRPYAYSALFLFNCTGFTLSHAHFSSSRGSGVSLYNVLGDVTIERCEFIGHTLMPPARPCETLDDFDNCSTQSTGLYLEFSYCQNMTSYCYPDTFRVFHVKYVIRNSVFEGNENMGAYRSYTDIKPIAGLSREQHWPFGRGGGLGVVFCAYEFKHLELTVEHTHFRNNQAVYGGGMFLQLEPGYSDHGHFNIINCTFTDNVALINGGGLDLDLNVLYHTINGTVNLDKSLRNFLLVDNTHFVSNEGYWGGGVSLVLYPTNISYLFAQFTASHWWGNKYVGGAGAIGILRKEKPEQEYFFIPSVSFTDCYIGYTTGQLSNGSFSFLSCSLYSEGISLFFYGATTFESNCASALCLSDTGATFFNDITFFNNRGFNGGALFLTGKSFMTVSDGVRIDFTNNSAYQYGGAIYYLAPPPLEMSTSGSCFVWYHQNDNINVPLKYWWINVSFSDNVATQGGDAVFISNPEKCMWPDESSLFDPSRIDKFDYSGQRQDSPTHVISTPTKSMRVVGASGCVDGCGLNCGSSGEIAMHCIVPGDSLNVKIETLDYFNQTVPAVLSMECHSKKDYQTSLFTHDICSNDSKNFSIGDRLVQSNTLLDSTIITGLRGKDFILIFRTCEPISILLPLNVSLTDCPYGYQYVHKDKKCTCGSDLTDDSGSVGPVACIVNSLGPQVSSSITPCIRSYYWAGYNVSPHDNTTLYYQFCYTGKCNYMNKTHCGKYPNYHLLEKNSCFNDLSGALCSSCESGKELTYNAYSCSSNCTTPQKIGLVCLIFLGCFVVVFFILIILRLNVRVSTAAFYSFLYFYSVLPVFLWVKLPVEGLEALIALISSVTSLDFSLLQYTQFCLFSGVKAIHYEFIHYIYPITIGLIIIGIIKADRHCFKKVQLFTGNSAVQVLCIMLLIVYTSISVTSLNILLPLFYYNGTTTDSNVKIHQAYVYVDPSVEYFDHVHHLPYWIIAFLVEFGFVLPFGVFMVLAPFLMRCFNLSRVKPLLDEYQNCFHDNHRWFAGVYLLARQALFLISMVVTNPETMSYVQQNFCLLLLILVATLQPYRNHLINKMDILFLFLLTMISFSGYNATSLQTFHSETSHIVMLMILSLLPCVMMCVGFLGLAVWHYVLQPLMLKRVLRLQHVLSDESDTYSNTSEEPPLLRTEVTRSTWTRSDRELPPRFYDEEEVFNETTRLLQSTPRGGGGGGGGVGGRYSINNGLPHTH